MKTALALVASLAIVGAAPGGALVVKASPSTSPCAAAAAAAFRQATGGAVLVQTAAIGPVGSAAGADVVVAIEEELTRVIEGGESAPDVEVDVASIPWVLTGAGAGTADLRGLARSGARVRVLGGAVGRHARQSLESLPADRVQTARTPDGLRNLAQGELTLVPLSLAGPGPVAATDVPALLAQAVGVRGSPRGGAARAFIDFLATGPGNEAFRHVRAGHEPVSLPRAAWSAVPLLAALSCGEPSPTPSPTPTPCPAATSPYATTVTEWWIPASSLAQNVYNNPQEALGAPNAAGFGLYDYTGFVSLGFGGHVTVDLGGCVSDVTGPDLRIYQAVSNEPLSVYVSTSPEGPFTLLQPFFQNCGTRVPGGGTVRRYCDFDLASAAVRQARYVRVEDAEIFPCPCGTPSEGADLDAVQSLAVPSALGRSERRPQRTD